MRHLHVEQPAQESLALIVLLEQPRRESTFLGSQAEQLTVVVFRPELLSQHATYLLTAGTHLSAHHYNNMFHP